MINQIKSFLQNMRPEASASKSRQSGYYHAITSVQAEIERLEAEEARKIEFTRLDNDINGNPRYVCHYLNLLSNKEMENLPYDKKYDAALNRAHQLGGRKYHNKKYGGGIVFQSYNLDSLTDHINKLRDEADRD